MPETKKPAKQKSQAKLTQKPDVKKSPRLKAQIERLKAREGDRGKGPYLEIEIAEDGVLESKLPDGDFENALAMLDLAGTANPEFAEYFMGQIASFAINLERKPGKNQKAVNAIMGAVHGLALNDEAEAMLISQMAACQGYTMELMTRAAHAANTDTLAVAESIVNMANKLMRTFNAQMQTLARYRGKTSQQKVIVEHVNVEAGGQAVVGAVQTGGEGHVKKNG